jgi:predicted membrane-bound spermidine synthase
LHDRLRPPGARGAVTGAYVLTFMTGASALVYEIVWQRYLQRLLGSDGLATATVLGVFLAGLSAGYFVCGRLSERSTNLFRDYGRLELVVGVWALAFPALFQLVDRFSAAWAPRGDAAQVAQGVLLGATLMAVPTVCMGATIPMLTRALSASLDGAATVQARVYGLNALGAGVGTLAAAWLLIPRMGMVGAIHAAAAPNMAAALYFMWLARRHGAPGAAPSHAPGRSHGGARRAAAIAFLAGFSFITMETALIRVGYLTAGGSYHTLASTVAVFVACVALGSLAVARLRSPGPALLCANQAFAAVATLALFATLDKWPYAYHLLRIRFPSTEASYLPFQLTLLLALLALLSIPVGAMGATLPLAFRLARRDARRLDAVGRVAGTLYGWNALGNLLGGVLGGYLFYRWLGIGELFLLAVACIGVTVPLAAVGLGAGARAAAWTVAALVLAGIAAFPAHDPLRFAAGTFRLREPLAYSHEGPRAFYDQYYRGRIVRAYRDDPDATFAVIENPRPAQALAQTFPDLAGSIYRNPSFDTSSALRPKAIMINGKADSNTWFDRETLLLLAHAPALLAPAVEDVLVIGLGTGVTAGEIGLHDGVKRIDVVEIAPGVVDLLPHFADANHAIGEDPRTNIRVEDAFRVLRSGDRRWDLIVSQPSNPWALGNDLLFSREFFRLARRRLSENGLFAHWVQRYATDDRIYAIAVNTLRSEFEHVRVFRAGADDLFVASATPLGDGALGRARQRIAADADVRDALASIGIHGVPGLLAREHPEALLLAEANRSAGLETLARPRIHHLACRAFFLGRALATSRPTR